MRLRPIPHRWNLSPRAAIAVQKRLAKNVIEIPLAREPRLVAGLDAAFSADGKFCIAGAVLWDCVDHRVVEQRVAWRKLAFPYVPGLLSFREAPALLAALRKLQNTPDVLICDGQGRAHPRRFGIACHVGVITNLPTVGCAKSRLIGEYSEPRENRGATSPLTIDGEVVGIVIRTRDGINPLFVSVGHRIDLDAASDLVLDCSTSYRLPEPTRLADRLVAQAKLLGIIR